MLRGADLKYRILKRKTSIDDELHINELWINEINAHWSSNEGVLAEHLKGRQVWLTITLHGNYSFVIVHITIHK